MQIHRSPTLPLERVGGMPLHQTPFKITLKIIFNKIFLNATHFLKKTSTYKNYVCRLALRFRVKNVTGKNSKSLKNPEVNPLKGHLKNPAWAEQRCWVPT